MLLFRSVNATTVGMWLWACSLERPRVWQLVLSFPSSSVLKNVDSVAHRSPCIHSVWLPLCAITWVGVKCLLVDFVNEAWLWWAGELLSMCPLHAVNMFSTFSYAPCGCFPPSLCFLNMNVLNQKLQVLKILKSYLHDRTYTTPFMYTPGSSANVSVTLFVFLCFMEHASFYICTSILKVKCFRFFVPFHSFCVYLFTVPYGNLS